MKRVVFFIAILLLFVAEMSRVYFIMPFPGSQSANTIDLAYWMHNNLLWIRIALLAVILATVNVYRKSGRGLKIFLRVLAFLYLVIFYLFNYRFQADKMFLQPGVVDFRSSSDNKVLGKQLVMGIVMKGEAKAYPIQVLGYHHQIRDTLNHVPVMITYCTVCRTGRVYSPLVNGKPEVFRLVGMDHFNAMFEDSTTKSWWQQATGKAVAGKLKGSTLAEIPSEQATLDSWLSRFPGSEILQPDTMFNKRYASLDKYDNGTTDDELEKRDSASWNFKSWVIGVEHLEHARAYDWNLLTKRRLIEDSLPGLPLIVSLEKDTASFHVLSRQTKLGVLTFSIQDDHENMTDHQTGSKWNTAGTCIEGPLKGEALRVVQGYQEFWHSWRTFHPHTTLFKE